MCAHWGGGASTHSFAPRTFPLGRPRPWMSAAVLLQYRNPKRKRHHESYFENEEGGCARADSEGTRRSPKLGGGFLPPPKQAGARAPAPQSGSARRSAKPRHLGASSHSGNVRGGCRGWTSLATDDQI